MPYRVTGIGPHGAFAVEEDELWRAAYTAAKMSDNGVKNVLVFDADGRIVDTTDAPLPPGWIKLAP